MKREISMRSYAAAFLGLGLLAAAPFAGPEDYVRRGNAALDRGEYQRALSYYAQAEEHIPDPGLVAFNEATALYHLGRYREAELAYRCCREDAVGPRKARLLYNLGNCILQQGWDKQTRRLREAIRCYEECLQHPSESAEFAANARHNLELACLLLLKARAAKDGGESNDAEPPNEPSQPDNPDTQGRQRAAEPGMAVPDPRGRLQNMSGVPREDNNSLPGSSQPLPPGKGNLPPVPDSEDLAPLAPEDAAAILQQEAARIFREHRQYQQRPIPLPAPHVKDW